MAKSSQLNPTQIKNILIIRLSSIGDIVLTTPIIRCVRRQFPNSRIDFLVKENFKTVVEDNPHINNIICYTDDQSNVLNKLSEVKYDFVIDLHKNIRSKKIISALKAPFGNFPKLNFKKWLYTNFKINYLPKTSIVERYFMAVDALGVKNDGQGLDYFVPAKDRTQLEDIPLGHWSGFVGAVIGGAHGTKRMPVDNWKAFVDLCQYPIVLLGGPEDKAIGDEIAQHNPGKVYNSCGKFNLNESADLIQRAKVIVAHDTGLMHIAAAFKKAIVSIWGNTAPEIGMFPYYGYNDLEHNVAPQSIMISHKASCSPCSKIGYDQCPKKHFNCMTRMSAQEINVGVDKLWASVIAQEKSEGKFI